MVTEVPTYNLLLKGSRIDHFKDRLIYSWLSQKEEGGEEVCDGIGFHVAHHGCSDFI